MARRSKLGGFTLVELLVVISIIGMLMSLLFVAVQSARESARRTTCANNQHQVVVALEQFESVKRYYPGSSSRIYKGPATTATPTTTMPIVSYIVPLLPYLERTDLFVPWTNTAIVSATPKPPTPYIEVLNCPSNPRESKGFPYLSYVINGGVEPGSAVLSASPPPPPSPPWKAKQRMASGIAFDQTGTVANENIRVGKDYIDGNDGTSTTLLLSENLQSDFWMPSTAITTQLPTINTSTAKTRTTFLWKNNAQNPAAPGDPWPINASPRASSAARPSSNHSGGVNTHFADAHYKFLDEDIDYRVFRQLMTTADELLPIVGGLGFQMPPLNTAAY